MNPHFSSAAQFLLSLLAIPLVAAALFQIVVAVWTMARDRLAPHEVGGSSGPRPRVLVLMPAHNESTLIVPAARSLRNLDPTFAELRTVIIADNCTDDTAALARSQGVEVLERTNPEVRGKPAAIQWAVDMIGLTSFDAVAIVDADTEIDREFFNYACRFPQIREIAVQGYFGVSNVRDSWLSRLGEFLARVRYDEEYPSKDRAGLNVPLTGNGMVLGADLFVRAGWPINALTENWDLYARYTLLGARIRLARGAVVRAVEANTLRGGSVQRKRWMAGRAQVVRRYVRPLVARANWRRDPLQVLDALGELLSPGPVIQLGGSAIVGAIFLFALPTPGGPVVAGIVWSSSLPLVLRLATAWRKHPNRLQLLVDALRMPVYLGWRVLTAAQSIATARRGTWERSPRDP